MSSASSSFRCALRRRPPPFPLINCPDCGLLVKQSRSGTADHLGWEFYKCKNHGFGCEFWHWELEYITYLVQHGYIQGELAVDAVGWAEERREALEKRKQDKNVTKVHGREGVLLKILDAVNEMVVLLKLVLVMLVVLVAMCAVVVLKK